MKSNSNDKGGRNTSIQGRYWKPRMKGSIIFSSHFQDESFISMNPLRKIWSGGRTHRKLFKPEEGTPANLHETRLIYASSTSQSFQDFLDSKGKISIGVSRGKYRQDSKFLRRGDGV